MGLSTGAIVAITACCWVFSLVLIGILISWLTNRRIKRKLPKKMFWHDKPVEYALWHIANILQLQNSHHLHDIRTDIV
jgi:hypothetical protein